MRAVEEAAAHVEWCSVLALSARGDQGGQWKPSAQVARLLYAVQMQHVVRSRGLLILLLDLLNVYGQVNRVAMPNIMREEPLLKWARDQVALLYAALVVHVQTPLGLTSGYRVAGGCIQRGGMDPFRYI